MTEQTTIVVIGSLKAKTCLCNVYSNVSLYYIVKQICMDLQQYLDFRVLQGSIPEGKKRIGVQQSQQEVNASRKKKKK